ncbi:MAG: hypothetical protein AB1454_04035 [Candidatus Auribacterota bacterium]
MKKLIILSIMLLLLPPSIAFSRTYELSPAELEFRNQNYSKAITLFTEELQKNPSDSKTLKYLGISYLQLRNGAKAVYFLEQAKTNDMSNVGIRYYLAQAYMLNKQADMADAELSAILTDFPETAYTMKAKDLKASLRQPRRQKPLSVYQKFGYQYDSNVALEPQKGGIRGQDKDSSRFLTYTWVEYAALQDKNWSAGVNGSFYQNFHTENDLERYNLSSFKVGPFLSFSLPVCQYVLNNRVEYRYRQDILNGDSFARANQIRYEVSSYLQKWLELSIHTLVSFDDFFYRGTQSRKFLFNRDAVFSESGIRAKFLLPEHRMLSLGYDYGHNDAEGTNWNYEINGLYAEFMTPVLTKNLLFFIRGDYYNRYFSPFDASLYNNSTAERDENYFAARFKTQYNFNRNTALETSYQYANKQTNLEEYFEYERQVFEVSLIFRF